MAEEMERPKDLDVHAEAIGTLPSIGAINMRNAILNAAWAKVLEARIEKAIHAIYRGEVAKSNIVCILNGTLEWEMPPHAGRGGKG